ncbi:response regulator [Pseudomonas capsici]|uniref:Response regulator n=1 Tax=Pseudomonas capsici TaxID=2810614 RepID=A0ABT3C3L2_9PSED|nr:response regulator [Pseudomonas capsici]MBN6715503.1 response regulator [Pseudomonas capsici]MBN6720412.1 response regulator [Pseudomonas capsici]MBN6725378.1 response regulator [Pseudomonas capsici]MCV4270712.1 response regulator [Pseudomonas capsici]MCV4280906.1 response regulator [Pseudomonas capsici]
MNSLLLVEDENKTAEMLKQGLESEGIEVTWVTNGKDAIDLIKPGIFDLIILDLKLPGMTGDQALEEIRKIDPYVDVVVYTNYQEPPVMQKLINLGVEGYISKGADADLWETVKIIKKMLDPLSEEDRDQLLSLVPSETFKNL